MYGVIKYTLTPEEIELVHTNRTDLIPTAEQRGLVAPILPPRVFATPKQDARKPQVFIAKTITKEMLSACMAEGLSNQQLGDKYGISAGTVSMLLKKHGLANPRGKRRRA